ncbi:MAG: ABC transporter permease subunit [Caldilinea sp. CFX5]|nr:ABC transporter permease subunit [Caldilinea sp. CFX5]
MPEIRHSPRCVARVTDGLSYYQPRLTRATHALLLATLSLSLAILAEAGLSFLGLGAQPPDAAWGLMLSQGRKFMELPPVLAIMVTVLAFNFLGDGLRDALDPRLRE